MAQPLTDAINALTRYANETTGASDTTLSDAVETLVEGYGQGGGGSVSQDAEGYIVLPVDGGGGSMPHFLEPSEQSCQRCDWFHTWRLWKHIMECSDMDRQQSGGWRCLLLIHRK